MLPHLVGGTKACARRHVWRPLPITAKIMGMSASESYDILTVLSHHPAAITSAQHATTAQGLPQVHGCHSRACGAYGAPRLPTPEPDRREVDAQGERELAEVQPWEEGQRLYRQSLENALIEGAGIWERACQRSHSSTSTSRIRVGTSSSAHAKPVTTSLGSMISQRFSPLPCPWGEILCIVGSVVIVFGEEMQGS
jgi:hypothetical protein